MSGAQIGNLYPDPEYAHPASRNRSFRLKVRLKGRETLEIEKLRRAGSEEGIRTLDTGLPYTRFPGVRLQPLGHLTPVTSGAMYFARGTMSPEGARLLSKDRPKASF